MDALQLFDHLPPTPSECEGAQNIHEQDIAYSQDL